MNRLSRVVLLTIIPACAVAQDLPREPLSKADRKAARHHDWCEWNNQKIPVGRIIKSQDYVTTGLIRKKHVTETFCRTCLPKGKWEKRVPC